MVVPCFFRIMAGDFKSALRLPRLFVKKFEGDFPDKALLETKYGESWSIQIEKTGDDYCLNHGWAQFVNYHQLEMCDLLLFKPIPEEKLAFRVFMFGPSACEKELSFDTQCDPPSNSDPEDIANLQEYTPSPSKSMASQERNSSKNDDDTMKVEGSSYIPELYDDELVGKESRCLVVHLKIQNRSRIIIPMQFAQENKLIGKKSVSLENSKGETWPAKLATRHCKNKIVMEMVRGWSKFWKQNKLVSGERCALEFIPDSDCFRVHLLRRVQTN